MRPLKLCNLPQTIKPDLELIDEIQEEENISQINYQKLIKAINSEDITTIHRILSL